MTGIGQREKLQRYKGVAWGPRLATKQDQKGCMIDLDQHLAPALQPTSTGLKAIPASLALRRGLGQDWVGWELVFPKLPAQWDWENGAERIQGWGAQKWETLSPQIHGKLGSRNTCGDPSSSSPLFSFVRWGSSVHEPSGDVSPSPQVCSSLSGSCGEQLGGSLYPACATSAWGKKW